MTAKIITAKAWELWYSMFKNGDDVVLEDDQGEFHFGRVFTYDWGIKLFRPSGIPVVEFKWKQITFIAQGGFPVQEIMGMKEEEAYNLCDKLPTEVIRAKIVELCEKQQEKRKANRPFFDSYIPKSAAETDEAETGDRTPRSYRATGGCGCPFVFEDVVFEELRYAGNNGPQFWGEDNEETLIMRAKNGARMLSYDLSHVFFFDGLEKQFDITLKRKPMNHIEKVW